MPVGVLSDDVRPRVSQVSCSLPLAPAGETAAHVVGIEIEHIAYALECERPRRFGAHQPGLGLLEQGTKQKTLQERTHDYDITYGSAIKANVLISLQYVIAESNKYPDGEVFLWNFSHGVGNQDQLLTGGKLFQSSEIFLWDYTLTDKELGSILAPLESHKATILVDACYAGGFADRTIFNFHTSLFYRSGIPQDGRVIIWGTSKFRPGYASVTQGPVFSLLWFEGLSEGLADGYKPGLFDQGVLRDLNRFQDGIVSVEEAFYYARYQLRTNEKYEDFKSMQPQINDQYPDQGLLRSRGEFIL